MFNNKPKHSFLPKNFFLHAGGLISLYASIIFFLTLVYAIITLTVGESFYVPATVSSIRFGVSGIIITFPLYIIISHFLGNMYRENSDTVTSHTKRWSGYMTLFIAGIALAIDLMVVVYTFMEGDTTLAFLFKALAVLAVFATVFFYQFNDIKREDYSNRKFSKKFASVTALVVLGFVVTGFMFAGSPESVRKQQRDVERVSDLRSIQQTLTSHWQQKGELPEDLDMLEDALSGRSVSNDPNGEEYTYTKTGEKAFTLCAVFEAEYQGDEFNTTRDAYYSYQEDEFFKHDVGETCFEREIDEDIYPIHGDLVKPVPSFQY
jgi:hypothetical protein